MRMETVRIPAPLYLALDKTASHFNTLTPSAFDAPQNRELTHRKDWSRENVLAFMVGIAVQELADWGLVPEGLWP